MKIYNVKHPSGVDTQMQLTEEDAKVYGDNATVAGDVPDQASSTVEPGPADPDVAYDRGTDDNGDPIQPRSKTRRPADKSRSAEDK